MDWLPAPNARCPAHPGLHFRRTSAAVVHAEECPVFAADPSYAAAVELAQQIDREVASVPGPSAEEKARRIADENRAREEAVRRFVESQQEPAPPPRSDWSDSPRTIPQTPPGPVSGAKGQDGTTGWDRSDGGVGGRNYGAGEGPRGRD